MGAGFWHGKACGHHVDALFHDIKKPAPLVVAL